MDTHSPTPDHHDPADDLGHPAAAPTAPTSPMAPTAGVALTAEPAAAPSDVPAPTDGDDTPSRGRRARRRAQKEEDTGGALQVPPVAFDLLAGAWRRRQAVRAATRLIAVAGLLAASAGIAQWWQVRADTAQVRDRHADATAAIATLNDQIGAQAGIEDNLGLEAYRAHVQQRTAVVDLIAARHPDVNAVYADVDDVAATTGVTITDVDVVAIPDAAAAPATDDDNDADVDADVVVAGTVAVAGSATTLDAMQRFVAGLADLPYVAAPDPTFDFPAPGQVNFQVTATLTDTLTAAAAAEIVARIHGDQPPTPQIPPAAATPAPAPAATPATQATPTPTSTATPAPTTAAAATPTPTSTPTPTPTPTSTPTPAPTQPAGPSVIGPSS